MIAEDAREAYQKWFIKLKNIFRYRIYNAFICALNTETAFTRNMPKSSKSNTGATRPHIRERQGHINKTKTNTMADSGTQGTRHRLGRSPRNVSQRGRPWCEVQTLRGPAKHARYPEAFIIWGKTDQNHGAHRADPKGAGRVPMVWGRRQVQTRKPPSPSRVITRRAHEGQP